MMLYGVLVEGVDRNRLPRRSKRELSAGHEPKQIALAAAMRAIALHCCVEGAFNLERDLPAVATTSVCHRNLLYCLTSELRLCPTNAELDALAIPVFGNALTVKGPRRIHHPCPCRDPLCVKGIQIVGTKS